MRWCLALSLLSVAAAQTSPVNLGDSINLLGPAINAGGSAVLFAAGVTPAAAADAGTNLYVFENGSTRKLTSFQGGTARNGVSTLAFAAGRALYVARPDGPGSNTEEIHLLDVASGADRLLVTDTAGCPQPICVNCAASCIGSVHLSPDGSQVIYWVARSQPLYVIPAQGGTPMPLPVASGFLAPSPQRVVSGNGVMVFTSQSATAGTTPGPMQVYTIRLDGTGLTQVTRFQDPSTVVTAATISADGSLIAFASDASGAGRQTGSQIWVVRPDGSGLRQLSESPDAAGSPSVSADGSVVAFVQGKKLMRGRTTDGSLLALVSFSISTPLQPVVSDDGSAVAFERGTSPFTPAAVYCVPTDGASDPRAFVSVYAPRFLNAGGVVSATNVGPPSPGSLITVYGANLVPDELTVAGQFPLPDSLDGISLLVNGQPVPVLAVTPWQINAQLAQTVPPGTTSFAVGDAGGAVLPAVSGDVRALAPSNFSYNLTRGTMSYIQAVAFHAGTGIVADVDHPAAAGETLQIFGEGFGATDPDVPAGTPSPSQPPAQARQTPALVIGNQPAQVTFAGLAPGLPGVYLVNVVVPARLTPGIQSLMWQGNNFFQSAIAVK